ncbi:uncharacterized protein LOC109826609 [Asparagus officinalis]|uniref:uncharacterized protein LOC109826609 n=1 Tax=Asparagus officinalis TaxID=4686 RepID=UPI00098DF6E3|nr:uncharacterized protein LOC109826609 [Asparagus officinalis]
MKGVQRFGRREKHALRFIGLFQIVECVGVVTYRLDLSASMLKKHLRDEELRRVLDVPAIELQVNLTTIEIPVHILTKEDRKLRNKVIPLVKVQWNRKGAKEASWEDTVAFNDGIWILTLSF